MIKRYNQFVNGRLNENDEFDEPSFDETEGEMNRRDMESEFDEPLDDESVINEPVDELESEEEGGDLYASKLQEVADKLGVDVTGGKVEYNGKKIIFPSETEMYHVGNKKFKTSDEVVSYLENGPEDRNRPNVEEVREEELELQESKSYRKTRFKK